jgi:putative acetyltransferase
MSWPFAVLLPATSATFMHICIDDPTKPEILDLLAQHLADMALHSPPESVHALDPSALTAADVTFWAAWDDHALLGCGALKAMPGDWGEIKSMRTAEQQRGRGVAQAILDHIITEAAHRGYARLNLETGSAEVFAPARRLYLKNGFVECEPFGDYELDPYSVFMTRPV